MITILKDVKGAFNFLCCHPQNKPWRKITATLDGYPDFFRIFKAPTTKIMGCKNPVVSPDRHKC